MAKPEDSTETTQVADAPCPEPQDGLICAYMLDAPDGEREVDWQDVVEWTKGSGCLWVHLDRSHPRAHDWIENESGISKLAADALLDEDTRPRCAPMGQAVLVNLRGVNLNPGADPEDMVSLRLYLEPDRVISVRHRRLLAAEDVRREIVAGADVSGPAEFLSRVADRLIHRMGPVISDLDDAIDELEDRVLNAGGRELRGEIADLRRRDIALRRYLAPQRDVLSRLQTDRIDFFTAEHKLRFRENADQLTRYVESLDTIRDRATVVNEELQNRLSERMNTTMYVLSLVAGVFLPLGFVTGLLGINVGGIPGTEYPWAFAIVTGCLFLVGLVELWLLRRLQMF